MWGEKAHNCNWITIKKLLKKHTEKWKQNAILHHAQTFIWNRLINDLHKISYIKFES